MSDDVRLASTLASEELRALRTALLAALVARAPKDQVLELVEQVNRMTRQIEELDVGA